MTLLFIGSGFNSFAQNYNRDSVDSLRKKAMACYERNAIAQAILLQQAVLCTIEQYNLNNTSEYAESLRDYALFISEDGKIQDAISYIEEAIAIFDSLYTRTSLESALARLDLASYHSALSHYDIALEEGKGALQSLEKLDSVPQDNYSIAVAKVSRFYEDTGDHEQSLILAIKALTLIENAYGHYSDRYAQMLDQLSFIYYQRGDIQKAITHCQESCDILSSFPNSPFYVYALNDLAAYCCDSGDVLKSIELGNLACSLAEDSFGKKSIFYINTINNLARYYSANKDVDKAIEQSKKALALCNEMGLNDNISYARSLGHLANFYSLKGDFESAIKYAEESRPIFKTMFGEDTPGYLDCIRDLSRYYFRNNDYSNAISYIESTNAVIQDIVLRAFSYMPSHERFLYWNWYKDWFYYEIPNFCFSIRTKQIACLSYNSVLFSKGILLNTDVEERRIAQEKDGESSLSIYMELQNARKEIDMLQYGSLESENKRDSLTRVIVDLSDQLSRQSSVFGCYIKKQSAKWEDVKSSLKKGEIAIEFVKVDRETDSYYIALTLKKGYMHPHVIELFSESQLRSIKEQSYYRSDQLFNLIWRPLHNELLRVKSVYFSPDGCLHSIGIENVLTNNNKPISNSYSLFRLSSTRELVFREERPKNSYAALFGGLDYNYNPDSVVSDTTCIGPTDELTKDLYRSISRQGQFRPLPATLKEIDDISLLLSNRSIENMVYKGRFGTEETFKGLSGSGLNIIHLATHGEYIPSTTSSDNAFLNRIAYERDITNEDNALTRSFIVMTGGNLVTSSDIVKDSLPEDGILTSYEISKLCFSDVNVVVLSACKTANGDISEDGVMGLQRGFKKSGAKTIIMSLWEVEDVPTQYLMTRFYYYYTNGRQTNTAFNMAKTDLKNKYETSGARPYWAAFIILDALN